jgi:hypothetical protein
MSEQDLWAPVGGALDRRVRVALCGGIEVMRGVVRDPCHRQLAPS